VGPQECAWGREIDSIAALAGRLAARPAALRVRRVPNARVAASCAAAQMSPAAADETLGQLAVRASAQAAGAVDPEDVWALAEASGLSAAVTWSKDDDGAFDAVFLDKSLAGRPIGGDAVGAGAADRAAYATNPAHGCFNRNLMPELQSFLRARLPDYMVPTSYVRLAALPINANGKVDKTALPEPGRLRATREQAEPPRTDTQRAIAAIFERVLGAPGPGLHEHFFNDLGGHSLLATRVVAHIRSELGADLPLRLIFEDATIAGLARHVEAFRASAPSDESIPELVSVAATLDPDALEESDVDAALAALLAAPGERP